MSPPSLCLSPLAPGSAACPSVASSTGPRSTASSTKPSSATWRLSVEGQPFAIPTGYARVGDALYVHGSAASRMVRHLVGRPRGVLHRDADRRARAGAVGVPSLGELPLGRRPRDRPGWSRTGRRRLAALRGFTDHVVPGRWAELRPITDQELKGTAVLALPIEEASAKVRTGPPMDDEEDLSWPVWAGVVPLALHVGVPVPDDHVRPGTAPMDPARLATRGRTDG